MISKEEKFYIEKSYKYRIYPTQEQIDFFHKSFGCERFLYNYCANIQLEKFHKKEKLLSNFDLDKLIPTLKKEYTWLKEANSQSLQKVTKDVKRSVNTFFNKCKKGKPSSLFNFKKKNSFKQSFGFPSNGQVKFIHDYKIKSKNKKKICYISIPKLKTPIKILKHRNWNGEIKNATISREADGYYISLQVSIPSDLAILDPIKLKKLKDLNVIGCDLGITKLFTTSNGDVFNPIHSYSLNQKKLEKLQQQFAKLNIIYKEQKKENIKELKESGKYDEKTFYFQPSKRYLNLQSKIRKLHQKITRIRHDYLHNISSLLVKNNDMIMVEDLKIAQMSKSNSGTIENPGSNVQQKSNLNKAILDQGWGKLKQFIDYKLTWKNDQQSIKVPPQYTSQTCSSCLHQSSLNRENQAKFDCIKCDNSMNADINASLNVLRLGLIKMGYDEKKSHSYTLKLIKKIRPWAKDGKVVDMCSQAYQLGFLVG